MIHISPETFGSRRQIPALAAFADEVSRLTESRKTYFGRFFQLLNSQLKDLKKLKNSKNFQFFWMCVKHEYDIKLDRIEGKFTTNLMSHLRCVVDTKFKLILAKRLK